MKDYPVRKVCRAIGISKSNYYREPAKSDSEKTAEEMAVIRCFYANDGNYGRVRVKIELGKEGMKLSEYRISRIMKANDLVAKGGRPRKGKRSKKTEKEYIEENLIKDKFSVTQANYLWCSDITEIQYKHSKLYLCGCLLYTSPSPRD